MCTRLTVVFIMKVTNALKSKPLDSYCLHYSTTHICSATSMKKLFYFALALALSPFFVVRSTIYVCIWVICMRYIWEKAQMFFSEYIMNSTVQKAHLYFEYFSSEFQTVLIKCMDIVCSYMNFRFFAVLSLLAFHTR